MSDRQSAVGFWDRLGPDTAGMPRHIPMGVLADGQGPVLDDIAHHYVCWCGDVECPLSLALGRAWASGTRVASPALPMHQDYGGPCGHREAYDAVTTHTRTTTPVGPDFCAECSEAIQEWVPWPCPRAKPDPLVSLLVEHAPRYNHRGYAVGCDACDSEDYPAPRWVGDPAPFTKWAEHIASLVAGPPEPPAERAVRQLAAERETRACVPMFMLARARLRKAGIEPRRVLLPVRLRVPYEGEGATDFEGSFLGLPIIWSDREEWGLIVTLNPPSPLPPYPATEGASDA